MTKKCSSCENLIDDSAAFCDMCGTPFFGNEQGSAPAAAREACPGCGAECTAGDTFCNNCGMLLPSISVSPSGSPVEMSRLAGGVPGRFIVNGSNYVFDFPGGKPELVVGRPEPDRRFFPDIDTTPAGGETAGVSRRHARITTSGGRVYIEDLGSTNFTFVNRQRLQLGQRVPLNAGDEVRMGRLVMRYYA